MSKQSPGGRCSLYMRYTVTLREKLGLADEVRYCDDGAEVPSPAMLIDDALAAPSDGVILSPEETAGSLRDIPESEVAELVQLLEVTEVQWMEEWSVIERPTTDHFSFRLSWVGRVQCAG